ncbi:MAG TPA: MlaD family protein [Thermodesulfobacteriota bacterium]|nr:MlaD family protein [Thermodesulfobacteriota bacterium]
MFRNLIVLFLFILIIAGFVYWFFIHEADRNISIVFDRADGIGTGSKLVLKGVPVGEVKDIKIGENGNVVVEASVYKRYKDNINSSSAFIIESADGDLDSDKKQITVEVLNKDAPPLPEDAAVKGYSSRAEFFVHSGGRILGDALDEFEDWLEEFQRGIEKFRESERGRELREDIEELMEDARRSAEKGVEELREEIPYLKERLNEIIEELRELGKEEDAEELRKGFDKYLESLENKTRKAKPERPFTQKTQDT